MSMRSLLEEARMRYNWDMNNQNPESGLERSWLCQLENKIVHDNSIKLCIETKKIYINNFDIV